MFIIEGFIIGLFGGAHCLGMCGPLALSLPLKGANVTSKIFKSLFYNIGRAFTYAFIGLIFGLAGSGLRISGFQQWISIICGVIMILSVLLIRFVNFSSLLSRLNPFKWLKIQGLFSSLMQKPKLTTYFFIGILNGFLPCGFVYIALGGALVSNSITESALFMFFFGLGTLPYLFVLIMFSHFIKTKYLHVMNKTIPYFVIVLGLLFILRGLNLGIPYLSPKSSEDTSKVKCCHT